MKLLTKNQLIKLIFEKLPKNIISDISNAGISKNKNKKYYVIYDGNIIHFGDSRYEDFTYHKDLFRREKFINRWKNNKNINNPYSGLFYSYNLLW